MKNILSSIFVLIFSTTLYSQAETVLDPLTSMQWSLNNTGQEIKRFEKELIRKSSFGLHGIDIGFDKEQVRELNNKKEVIVAVIDTGVDIHHEDLKGRIWYNSSVCKSVEDESKLPCHGFNFLTKTPDVTDDKGHGTHVAGIIAANWNNKGIAGITNSNIKIMPIKVLSNDVKGFVYKKRLITDIFADGIRFAIKNKADVINLSIGWPKLIQTSKMNKVLDLAYKANIPVVAAAGNNHKEILTYPCNHEQVICVGAIDNKGSVASFSNFGGKVDIGAPGESIVSTYPKRRESRILRMKGYELKNGTSSAAPMVSAIIANLKSQNSKITINEIKAKLFLSTDSLKRNDLFFNYGKVNQSRALKLNPQFFIAPILKNVQDVEIESNTKQFSLDLPIKNYLQKLTDVDIKFSFDSKNISILESGDHKLSFKKDEKQTLRINGKVNSLFIDSKVYLNINITKDNKELYNGKIALYFFLNIVNNVNSTHIQSNAINAKDILRIKGGRKFSNLKSISNANNEYRSLEYYYVNSRQQSKSNTIINILTLSNGVIKTNKLKIKKITNLISIFREDVNLDGINDYIVYSFNKKRKQFEFDFLDKKLKPLFGKESRWSFPLTAFEGLPLNYGYRPSFIWHKVNHSTFGNILVPLFAKKWFLPDLDNSNDITQRNPTIKKKHLYYLSPKTTDDKVEFVLRALDSYTFIEQIRSKLELDDFVSIKIEHHLNKAGSAPNMVKFIISHNENDIKKYFLITFSKLNDWNLKKIDNQYIEINRNNIFQVRSDKEIHEQEYLFVAKINRTRTRFAIFNEKNQHINKFYILENRWADPIFDIISSYSNEKIGSYGIFIESRYHIIHIDKDGKKLKLPINRDSSFPSVKFKENVLPIKTNYQGEVTDSLYVDSTQIFGDRLYEIIKVGNKLIRPIDKSFQIPKNCIQLFPVEYKGKDNYVLPFSCISRDSKYLKVILLKL